MAAGDVGAGGPGGSTDREDLAASALAVASCDDASVTNTGEAILRLSIALVVGMAIGLNRDLRHKPTGMRTLGLVSLATALVTMASVDFGRDIVDLNPVSRVIQGVLTGIGFIGAGAIIRDRSTGQVSGLTTAASVWITAAVGVACGLGAWTIVIVAGALTLGVLTFGGRIERAIRDAVGKDEPPSNDPPRP